MVEKSAQPSLFLVFCLLIAQKMSAQNNALPHLDSTQTADLAMVVVTAQFAPTDARQTVNSVRVINEKTIRQRAALNLEELLQTETSVRTTTDPILGNSLSINGMRGENVQILVDGVPVVGRLGGSVDAGQLPLNAVRQVEIIEGAQSLLYGSAASAGVVNLITRKSQPNRIEGEVGGQLESNGFRAANGRIGGRVGQFFGQISGGETDFLPETDTASRDQIWNPKRQKNASATLRFSPSEKFDLRLSGNFFNENVENLGEKRRPIYKPYAFDDQYLTNRSDLTLHGEGRTRRQFFWQTTLAANRFDRVKNTFRFDFEDEKKTLLDPSFLDTSAANGFLARTMLASDRAGRPWQFLAGAENYLETAESQRILDTAANRSGFAKTNDFAAFSALKWKFFTEKLTLQTGARLTVNQRFGQAVTPSVWLAWRVNPNWTAKASYAGGFRSPGLKELFFEFIDINHYVVGSPDLKPERSQNWRGELLFLPKKPRKTQVSATATAFFNKIKDRIVLAEYAPVQFRYANLANWKTAGGGLCGTVSRGIFRLRSDVRATGFFNEMAENIDTLPTLNWSLDWTNDLSAQFFDEKMSICVWHKMTGATPYFFEENGAIVEGRTQRWDLLNASVMGLLFSKKLRLTAGCKNILDVRQIRSGRSDSVHGTAGTDRPVHWGRTFFAQANLMLYKS